MQCGTLDWILEQKKDITGKKKKKRGFVKIKPAVKKKKKHLRQTSNPMLPQKELLSLKKVTDATNVHSVN